MVSIQERMYMRLKCSGKREEHDDKGDDEEPRN